MVSISVDIVFMVFVSAERLGSGDGERKTLLTREIAFEPLPASVLFGLGGAFMLAPVSIDVDGAVLVDRDLCEHRSAARLDEVNLRAI